MRSVLLCAGGMQVRTSVPVTGEEAHEEGPWCLLSLQLCVHDVTVYTCPLLLVPRKHNSIAQGVIRSL